MDKISDGSSGSHGRALDGYPSKIPFFYPTVYLSLNQLGSSVTVSDSIVSMVASMSTVSASFAVEKPKLEASRGFLKVRLPKRSRTVNNQGFKQWSPLD
jgi:hypothetical protein